MKSFSQFVHCRLIEEPDIGYLESKRYITRNTPPPKSLGKIGPYHLVHVPEDSNGRKEYGIVHVFHKKTHVGYLPFEKFRRGQIQINGPSIKQGHRGTKARVRDLMPKVYMRIADRLNVSILSDVVQSPGGASVWKRLAATRPLQVRGHPLANPRIRGTYNPIKHERHVYGKKGSNYQLLLHPKGKK